jgi:hypothetical protein
MVLPDSSDAIIANTTALIALSMNRSNTALINLDRTLLCWRLQQGGEKTGREELPWRKGSALSALSLSAKQMMRGTTSSQAKKTQVLLISFVRSEINGPDLIIINLPCIKIRV